MPIPVGIDLGTTNSVISVYRRGRAETLKVDGEYTMPSAVCLRDETTELVGIKALSMAMVRPERTILSVKRKIGDRNASYNVGGKTYSPIDISARILKKLCEGHEEELGGSPTHAVITVPAYFTDDQRRDTRLAGEQAGLKVMRLLPEPTAAAIAVGLDKGRDQTVMVYDLGGGTFDVSILRIQGNDFRVQAVNGNHDLGGNDFDAALRNHALNSFQKAHGIDPRKGNWEDSSVRQAIQTLTSACERIKIELTEAEEAFLDLPNFFQQKHLEVSITRKDFEDLIRPQILETKDLVLRTLKDAKLSVDDIDRLVLVGGSTKIPLVGRVLAETVKEPYVADNVDLAVSAGASIMAASLFAVEEARPDLAPAELDLSPVEINVVDVVSHTICVAMEGENGRIECTPVISKNSPLPATGMTCGAARPLQLLARLPVFRGTELLPENNQHLGMLTLTIEPSLAPTFIRFELHLDQDGVLQVEGSILDMTGHNPEELLWKDPKTFRSKRKVRAEIQMPD